MKNNTEALLESFICNINIADLTLDELVKDDKKLCNNIELARKYYKNYIDNYKSLGENVVIAFYNKALEILDRIKRNNEFKDYASNVYVKSLQEWITQEEFNSEYLAYYILGIDIEESDLYKNYKIRIEKQ